MRYRLALACLSLASASPAVARAQQDTGWVASSGIYEVFVRDFSPTGNIRGVTRGLDKIQAAGANVVWLMPIQPVGRLNRKDPLGSPYSGSDYRAINPDFGTAADFRALVPYQKPLAEISAVPSASCVIVRVPLATRCDAHPVHGAVGFCATPLATLTPSRVRSQVAT